MELARIVGRNLRELRLSRKLTQEDLEGLTGLKRSYISDLERGERNPSVRAIERLAIALEAKPEQFFAIPAGAVWPAKGRRRGG
jgi:transcriptional regulator with XRE-family HTH domain